MIVRMILEGEVIRQLPTMEVGDFGKILEFHIVREDGYAVDLTGKTVTFKARKLNQFNEYLFEEPATLGDAENGEASYEIQDTDLSEEGVFSASLEISEASVNNESLPLGFLYVRENH